MGRDTWRHQMYDKERDKRKGMNPVWRAIGCVLILVFAGGGYFLADWFMYQNETHDWIPIPEGLINIPFAQWLPSGIVVKLVIAIVFMVVGFGLVNLIYAILFPIKPGKYDAPPLKPGSRGR